MNITFYETKPLEKKFFEEALRRQPKVTYNFVADPLDRTNLNEARKSEIVSVFVNSYVSPSIMKKLPKLEVVLCRATGFDNVSLAQAKKDGIAVCNVSGYGEHTVAEYAFGLMLDLMRKLPIAAAQAKAGFVNYRGLTGLELFGKTLGVVGTGKIGAEMIRIANGFGMSAVGYDPFPKLELEQEHDFRYGSLKDVLRQADIVSLHAPAMRANRHMIGKRQLGYMKRGSLLINTARGDLVDTKALVEALLCRHLGGAGLDVLEGENLMHFKEEVELFHHAASIKYERLITEQLILEKMPNVIVSPHNAFNTHEALEKILNSTLQNILSWQSGKPLADQVNS